MKKMFVILGLLMGLLGAMPGPALAQQAVVQWQCVSGGTPGACPANLTYPLPTQTTILPGTTIIGKVTVLGVDNATASTLANPLSVQVSNGSTAVTYLAPGQAAMAASTPVAIASDQGSFSVTDGVPPGTAVNGNGSGSTGAVVGTLAGVSAKTTYICNMDVSAIGGTAAVGPVVVAGLLSGSFTYQISSSATGVIFSRTFTPCVPASAVNTAITVTTTADASATAVNVNVSGFQK